MITSAENNLQQIGLAMHNHLEAFGRFPCASVAWSLVVALLASSVRAETDVRVLEFLKQHCYDCHSADVSEGDLDLAALEWKLDDSDVRDRWVRLRDRVQKQEMPPDAEDLPTDDRQMLVDVLGAELHKADYAEVMAQGRGPLRRLSRDEYEWNLRDLLELPQLDIRDRLPAERSSHGFTKSAALLDVSHVQLEAYLDAAETALRQAIAPGVKPEEPKRFRAVGTDLFPSTSTYGEREAMFFARNNRYVTDDELKQLESEGKNPELEMALFRSAFWPYYGYPPGFRAHRDGAYRVRFSARAVRQVRDFRLVPADAPLAMTFRARQPSGPDVSGDVRATGGWIDLLPEPREFETIVHLKSGETFEYSLLGLPVPFVRTDGGFYYDFPPMPPGGHRGAAFRWLEVTGPMASEVWPPVSHRVLFDELPIRAAGGSPLPIEVLSEDPAADAERLLRRFAARAARGPVPEEAIAVYLKLISNKLAEGMPFAEAMLKGYQAFLCSGHVLYLHEPQGSDSAAQFAIASRLSHFLWNSRPDDRLLRLAGEDKLRDPQVLKAEVARMIGDDRFSRFVTSFTEQWLSLAELFRDVPDIRLYPEYRKDDYLVDSMGRETRAFFTAMLRENLPATTLVDADFTFVNDRLARHYDLPQVPGSAMRRVDLPDGSPYGGLLTQGAILKITSNGTTTSPVVRGVWVMERLLGQPPPAPPKEIPAIKPDVRGATTIREQLAKHTESDSCASCHAQFDPVGFALENFDVMGAWRDRYRGLAQGEKITGIDPAGHPYEYRVGSPVDSSGSLPSGEEFRDIHELKQILAGKPRQLARNLLQQFTLYSTGTPMRFSDRAEIEAILDRSAPGGYRIGDLLHEFVQSRIFLGEFSIDGEAAQRP